MGSDNQLNAVAATRALDLMCTRNSVWVCFERSKSRNPEVDVLASFPFEVNVLDSHHCGR